MILYSIKIIKFMKRLFFTLKKLLLNYISIIIKERSKNQRCMMIIIFYPSFKIHFQKMVWNYRKIISGFIYIRRIFFYSCF